MSYILDALKKAAEQRDVHVPAMRRLFTPDPEIADSPRWHMALLGGGAAFAGAAVVTMFWLLWPTATPVVVTETPEATSTRVQAEAPVAVEPPPPPAPIVRTAPRPAVPAKPAAPVKRAVPEPPAPVVEARRPAAEPASGVETRRAPVEPAPARPQPAPASPSVITALRPAPSVAATVPAPSARSESATPLRLQVIVYSEESARRLAFINGRKYVEGDMLLDGVRIQEIQPNAVVIIEDGRRVVLRP